MGNRTECLCSMLTKLISRIKKIVMDIINQLKLKRIQLFILDFARILTDNCVLVDENGVESIVCNRGDGLGIELLKIQKILKLLSFQKKNKQTGSSQVFLTRN